MGLGRAPGTGTGRRGLPVLSTAQLSPIYGSRVPWTLTQFQLVLALHLGLPDKIEDAQLNLGFR